MRAAPAFTSDYAVDLSMGERGRLSARYSAKGAYALGFEPKSYDDQSIAKRYAGSEWQKPEKFEWRDLSFEQLSPNTCLVAGGFVWTVGSRTTHLAYTAILRQEGSDLRIILEHENPLARADQK